MIKNMKEGSVIIDVSIDSGGCFETSEVTSHKNPVFTKHGVIHYCVPNMFSRVARTSSFFAICNVISPILIKMGEEGGINNLIKTDEGIRSIYTFKSMMTNKTLSQDV